MVHLPHRLQLLIDAILSSTPQQVCWFVCFFFWRLFAPNFSSYDWFSLMSRTGEYMHWCVVFTILSPNTVERTQNDFTDDEEGCRCCILALENSSHCWLQPEPGDVHNNRQHVYNVHIMSTKPKPNPNLTHWHDYYNWTNNAYWLLRLRLKPGAWADQQYSVGHDFKKPNCSALCSASAIITLASGSSSST